MCSVKTPKPQTIAEKKPVYLANPFLDSPLYRSAAIGRNALRIDRSSAARTPVNPNPVNPPPVVPPIGNPAPNPGGSRPRPGLQLPGLIRFATQ